MKKRDVKNTTKGNIFDLLFPCKCRVCGVLGKEVCDCCKNYISDNNNHCPSCFRIIRDKCPECNLPFFATFTLGIRDGVLGELVHDYKYKSQRRIGDIFAEMLDDKIPFFPKNSKVVIVPLPTISRHIRERGFDHTLVLAKKLAKMRGYIVEKAILRNENTVQVGSNMEKRMVQAERAYLRNQKTKIQNDAIYLLIDDVWTTGASMMAARKVLVEMGADPEKIGAIVLVKGGKIKEGLGGFSADGADDEIDNC